MKGSRIVAAIVAVLALVGVVASAEAQAYRRWYLAEGAANAFFNDTILIGNPNATAANVTIRLLPEGQPPFTPQTLVGAADQPRRRSSSTAWPGCRPARCRRSSSRTSTSSSSDR